MIVLGLHGGMTVNQHEPNAALSIDGEIVAACEEERFARVKSPRGRIPTQAAAACLDAAGIAFSDVDLVAHPGETYDDMPARIRHYLGHHFGHDFADGPDVLMVDHHTAHLASAFFASGFEEAMCLSYDARGDRVSTALARADRKRGVQVLETLPGENSLGIFYQTMTSYLGFVAAEDEYKVMGLAGYAERGPDLSDFARPTETGYAVDVGFFRDDPPVLSIYEPHFGKALVSRFGPAYRPGAPIDDRAREIAFATQRTFEACARSLTERLHGLTGLSRLCVAGGCGLNCSANGALRRLPFIDEIFIQPASSDRGLGLGAAMEGAFSLGDAPKPLDHVYLGPEYSDAAVEAAVATAGWPWRKVADPASEAAGLLARGKIIAWFQGRSEYGPRALGNRSILADPRPADMKDAINARIKRREEFRPFAPAVLEERAPDLYELDGPSPFMTFAVPVRAAWAGRLAATTHVDGTARVQTVSAEANPLFHRLIARFEDLTGVPAVLNTSFNVKGQPIVETPLDALSTFAATGLDAMIVGECLIEKNPGPGEAAGS